MSLGFSPLSVSASIPRLHFLHTAPYFPTPLEKHLNTGDAQKTVCAAFLSHLIPLPCSLLCSLSFLSIKLQRPLWKLLQAGHLASSRRRCPPLARNHLPQNIPLPIFSQVLHVPLSTMPANQLAAGSHALWLLSVPTDVIPLCYEMPAWREREDRLGMVRVEKEAAAYVGDSGSQ